MSAGKHTTQVSFGFPPGGFSSIEVRDTRTPTTTWTKTVSSKQTSYFVRPLSKRQHLGSTVVPKSRRVGTYFVRQRSNVSLVPSYGYSVRVTYFYESASGHLFTVVSSGVSFVFWLLDSVGFFGMFDTLPLSDSSFTEIVRSSVIFSKRVA